MNTRSPHLPSLLRGHLFTTAVPMPCLHDYSMRRSHPRVAGAFTVALWLLGTAQCFLAPPLAPGLNGISGASRITCSRSSLSSSTCVRQSIRGGFSVPAYFPLLVVSPGYWAFAPQAKTVRLSLLTIIDVQPTNGGV